MWTTTITGTRVVTAATGPRGASGPPEAPQDGQTYGRADGGWVQIPGGGDLVGTNNLSDVSDAATALTNLGGTPVAHDHATDYDVLGAAATAQTAAELSASTALTAHGAAADPHPTYLTAAEGATAFDPTGAAATAQSAAELTAATALAVHAADANAHHTPGGGGGGDLLASNNLSDVLDAATALANLGGTPVAHDHDADYDAIGAAATAQTAAELSASTALAAHEAAVDPHPTYLTAAEGSTAFDAIGAAATAQSAAELTASTALAVHEAAADPHPTYLTLAEGATAFDALGAAATAQSAAVTTAATALTAHEAAADPHPTYLTAAEGATAAQGATADSAMQSVSDDTTPVLAGALTAAAFPITDVGAISEAVTTVSAGATVTVDASVTGVHDVTMTVDCTISFAGAAAGIMSSFTLVLRGAHTPTLPGSVVWPDGVPPDYATPAVYVFASVDGGTVWFGAQSGAGFS